MDEYGYPGVVYQVESLFRRRVRGHDDDWVGVEGRRGKVCVIHKRDVGKHGIACCKM